MKRFLTAFVKITGWLPQLLCFRTKITYEDRAVQSRRIKGKAIVVCNHTSVYDYAVLLFVFFGRVLHTQMAEVLFRKKLLGTFLKGMGGIYVDRGSHNMVFVQKSLAVLEKNGVLCVFPEARLPREGEARPLPFQTSATYIALESGAPVIPVYTNGRYFTRDRAKVVIGKPFYAADLTDENLSEKENIDLAAAGMRKRVMELGKLLDEGTEKQ